MDDARLLAAVAGGDDMALRTLFDRHAPWIAARLRRTLPAAAVEDVVQETFVALWRGSGGYTGQGEPAAWIWGIARRQAALWLRANGRPSLPLDLAATAATPDIAMQVVRGVDLEQTLATLGADDESARELVQMVYVEERRLTDVAAILGIPTGTVKSRLFAVRRRLRTALLGSEE